MPNADDDQLGPELEERLRGELDRVQPRYSSPRYVAASRRPIIWRVAPAALVVGVLGILGLSGYVKTGSPNPVVWTERVVAGTGRLRRVSRSAARSGCRAHPATGGAGRAQLPG